MARPSFAISDGLVVTPSTMPHAAAFFSSSRFAVSRKNFIWQYPPLKSQCSSNYRATPRRRVPITLVVAGGFELCCNRPAVAAPKALDFFSDMIDIAFVRAARTHQFRPLLRPLKEVDVVSRLGGNRHERIMSRGATLQ